MPTGERQTPRVFISYSHDSDEHKERVRALADRLREDGIEVRLDRYLPPAGPEVGWARWMELEIVRADFVLVVCTERYDDKFYDPAPSGAGWEGAVLTQELYEAGQRNARFLPVLLEGSKKDHIPLMLRRGSWFEVVDDDGYVNLYRQLTGQPEVEVPDVGAVKRHPPRTDAELFADPPPPEPTYTSEHHREIGTRLDDAWERHETLTSEGEDTTRVIEEILDLKRQLRSGPDLEAGDILGGRYKLLDRLGKGGFSTVWRAYDNRRRELVAVKVIHGQYVRDESRLERFFRGAAKMARLDHPGIVRVVEEEAEDDGYHYFVMEYAAGGDLRRAVLEGKLSRTEAVEKILVVGEALHHAHQKGCVHRDVKPANILLTEDGRAKLSDFDLVRALDTTGGTRTHAALGSFLYSAPEGLADAKRAGVAADLYSLGITLVFALHGDELPMDIMRRTEGFVAELPAPGRVREALAQAAAWEPEERWESVAELVAAVRKGMEAGEEEQSGAVDRDIVGWIEEALPALSKRDRAAFLLRRVGAVLPVAPTDFRTLGTVAWALDCFGGRSTVAEEREAARQLRKELLAPLRDTRNPPELGSLPWADIPAGSFEIGSPESEGSPDGHPAHEVQLSAFRLMTVPVTNKMFRMLAREHEGDDDLPAVEIDWYTAYVYAAWLGGRLPTEAEWEYACRAGTTTRYWSGDSEADLAKVGWYYGNARRNLHLVGEMPANPWGLHDMHGLVWEWVADWYGSYEPSSQRDPWGPPGGGRRVFRGGSYANDARGARSVCRGRSLPWGEWKGRGFRVLLPAAPSGGS